MSNIKIECRSEIGTSSEPARVLVYEDGKLVAEITASIEPKQGADGGYYRCVNLTPRYVCEHNWIMDGHNAGDPICSKCLKRD